MVARKKLDQWADLLLDTGKRNNLINFRDTKAATAEVLLPSPDVLFEKIDGSASFEVFDPKIVDDTDDDSNVPSYYPRKGAVQAQHIRLCGHRRTALCRCLGTDSCKIGRIADRN